MKKTKKNTAKKAPHQSPDQAKKIKNRVFRLFQDNPEKSFSFRSILKNLSITKVKAKTELEMVLLKFFEKRLIKQLEDGTFRYNSEDEFAVGKVDFVSKEYAFIVCEGIEQDIRVVNKNMKQALDGDKVKIRIIKENTSRKEGEVVEVLERARTEFVGKIEISNRYAFVIPDHRKMYYDIFVRLENINKAHNGEKVVVQLIEWDATGKSPIGKVTKVLGKAGEHETEMNAIMQEFGLPVEFSNLVLHEADRISEEISETEIGKRRDFRKTTTFTIDPVDAKDFDDALSFELLSNGNYEIGVHIADVTHYVKEDTELEKEAQRRATSVYLVDRVVPMLPEKLSNMVCSLRPNEDKLTYSAVFEITPKGRIVSDWFGATIIHSNRRFSYEEAQEVLETGQGDFAQELNTLNQLAKIFQKKRFKSGAISFETVEVRFVLDENSKPIELIPKVRKDAHKLIEEFMLLANKHVAEFVYNIKKSKPRKTMVYRTHDSPSEDKLLNFAEFVKKFGYTIDTDVSKIAESMNALGEKMEGKPEQNVLQSLAIRTMAKAKYTTEEFGHFGLAFKHYSHFTSPIRRYPDMMAHRLLKHYLANGDSADKATYEKLSVHSSDMEKRAADAERASVKYKQVEYMQSFEPDQVFDGIITGLTEWGMYVEISKTKCEGMVRLATMEDDMYDFDDKKFCIVGRQTKRTIFMGDAVKVRLKKTDLEKRQIDLYMVY